MADTNTPAPTATEQPAFKTLEELSAPELSKWELDGTLPPKEPAEKDADTAAAKPAEQAASTDAREKAAPEAADPGKVKKPGLKKDAAGRAEDIERETAEAQERLNRALVARRRTLDALAAAEREPEKAPSKGADKAGEAAARTDAGPAFKKYAAMPDAPKRPKMDDFNDKGIDAYMDAVNDYSAEMAHFIAEKVAAEKAGETYDARDREHQAAAGRDRDFVAKAEKAEVAMQAELDRDPEIIDRIPSKWRELNPSDRLNGQRMSPAHFVKDQAMFNSDHPLQLSEWLCADDFSELKRVTQLRDPEKIIRALAIQDAKFSAGTETDPEAAAGERPHPRVSKAPAPVKGLPGKKAAAGVDPLKQAIAENDFDAFNALESERERAVSR